MKKVYRGDEVETPHVAKQFRTEVGLVDKYFANMAENGVNLDGIAKRIKSLRG